MSEFVREADKGSDFPRYVWGEGVSHPRRRQRRRQGRPGDSDRPLFSTCNSVRPKKDNFRAIPGKQRREWLHVGSIKEKHDWFIDWMEGKLLMETV